MTPLATAWHAASLVAIVAMLLGWRPSRRVACGALVVVLESVALASSAHGSAFHAISLALLALVIAALGELGELRTDAIAVAPPARVLVGIALIAYALCYPHGVAAPWYRALWAAPVGIAPCPTLALVAGVVIVADGFGSRALPGVVALWTVSYAYFGIVRLDVLADAGLVLAALGLVCVMVRVDPVPTTRHRPDRHGRGRSVRAVESICAAGEGCTGDRDRALAGRVRDVEIL
jgi:hypothetical protein